MKQSLLILNNASWPTLEIKAKELAYSFQPQIEFSITIQETRF